MPLIPELISTDFYIVLTALGLVILGFTYDRLAPDGVALAGLMLLTLTGVLTPAEALSGFASPAVMTIASLLIIGTALQRTGIVRWSANRLHDLTGDSGLRQQLVGTLAPGFFSGIINIVATVSVFIPVMLRLSLKTGRSPSRSLMPMAFVAMAGANLTLIGASHNLVVDSIIRERLDRGFGFFEFTLVGVALVGMASLYALVFARWLLPDRGTDTLDDPRAQTRALIDRYDFDEHIWELEVAADSKAADMALDEVKLGSDYGLSLISLVRKDDSRPHLKGSTELKAGDVLLVGGRRERVDQLLAQVEGLELKGEPAHRDDFSAGSAELIEVVVPPRSDAIGKTPRDLHLRKQADLTVIALWRDDQAHRTDVRDTPLEAGDALLLYGEKQYTRGFEPEPDFLWMHRPHKSAEPQRVRRLGPWTVAVFATVILAAATGAVPVQVAALTGALIVAASGALYGKHVYRHIDWRVIVLIAAMLPFATALDSSGVSQQLGLWLAGMAGQGALPVLALVALITLALTQVLHNAAAAAIMTPVALDAAFSLGANPMTFAVAVVASASMSVLLPVGHPAPLLVRKPGGYRTGDYLRFGAGMALLTLAVILVVVPALWPLQ